MRKLITAASIGFLILFSALPALASTQTFNRNLYYGLTHDTDVQALQQFLTTQGDYDGPISGNFFSLTKKAVVKFQQDNGIAPASGYLGALTRAVINKMLSQQSTALSQPQDNVPGRPDSTSTEVQSSTATNSALAFQMKAECATEVPPLSWTPKHLCFRSPRCRRNAPHTRLSSGGR